VFVKPVKEHRFVVVFRGNGLDGRVADTDPQAVGVRPLEPQPLDPAATATADVAKEFVRQACEILKDEPKANGLTLRGFASKPALPTYEELYGLRAAAIAVYPMYKGLASLVGMRLVGTPQTLSEQVDELKACWNDYDFFFLHFKYTDSTGEDGNFDDKVKRIEELDKMIPRIEELNPDVLIVTGDHSTPSKLKSHSWHPVPTLLVASSAPRPTLVFSVTTRFSSRLAEEHLKQLVSALNSAPTTSRLEEIFAHSTAMVSSVIDEQVAFLQKRVFRLLKNSKPLQLMALKCL
jgi:2,3-bisphosphoglycerate-independent phosphoglycerate mutase